MRLLFVTLGSPYPPDRGSQIRDFELIRRAATRHEVALISLVDSPVEASHLEAMRPHCVFTMAVCRPRGLSAARATLHHLVRKRPLATLPWAAPTLERSLREALERFDPDLVQIEHSFLAPYIDAIPAGSRAKTILSFHNVGSHQYQSMLSANLSSLRRPIQRLKARLMRDWEARIASRFDLAVAVSEAERALLLAGNPSLSVAVVENGVDAEAQQLLPEPFHSGALLFVGNLAYFPNADAVRFLADEILGRVRSDLPNVRLRVVGAGASAAIRRLAERAGIELVGPVPDLRPYYREALLALVPLRAGGGTRLKVLEAMAFGRAVVSTSIGSAGLPVGHGRELLLADHAAEFADAVVRLARDATLRNRLRQQARQLVERRFAWDRLAARLMAYQEELAGG